MRWLMLVAAAGLSSCRCDCRAESRPSPAPSAPEASAPPAPAPSAAPDAGDGWEPVQDLRDVQGTWLWASLVSKAWSDSVEGVNDAGQPWTIPYPWRLIVTRGELERTFDCGLFETLYRDGEVGRGFELDGGGNPWRVGYCIGGDLPTGKRTAQRVVLHVKRNRSALRVRIGEREPFVIPR